MKNPIWKKIALAAAGLCVTVAAIFYFTGSAAEKDRSHFVNPAFAEYISSYTTGVIPSGSSLTIAFPNDMVDSTLAGQESPDNLFDFSPFVAGKTYWVDKRTVEFRPESRMTSGKIYTARFFLSRLVPDLRESLRTFEYSFQIIPQNFEVLIVNVKPYNDSDLRREKIEGNVNTADYADSKEVERSVLARQEGKKLNVTWTHAEDGKLHSFVVEDVARKEEAGKVDLQVDGKPIGIERVQQVQVDIPPLADFKLTNVRVVQNPNQHIVLQFSDPVKEKQNLNGLIRISDLGTLDFDVQGNEIHVFPAVDQNGTKMITVEGIRNVMDVKLKNAVTEQVVFEQLKPAVRFTGKGSILPATNGLVLPFEAVNLKAVDVQVTRIHERNVLQFFQVNNVEGKNELRRVGSSILKKKVDLQSTGVADPGRWNRYTLDIAKLIQAEPGAIYEVKLGFRKAYSTYTCEDSTPEEEMTGQFEPEEQNEEDDFQDGYYYDSYDDYYYDEEYDWEQRDNPCHSSYFTANRQVSKNILASDIGLTAKKGEDGTTVVFVNDLKTTEPLSGVKVTLYSFQLQDIGSAVTDADGKVTIRGKGNPFSVVASNGIQSAYLRLVNGEALLVSNFDVSGEAVHKGLKGFLYGERGVWRPGDSLYLTFILEDKRKLLPANHPVVFELSNPQGQLIHRIVRAGSENGFYRFATATSADAPTGNWLGRVKVGGTEFTETIKIETVKPNRLKINLDFGTEEFTSSDIEGKLEVKWLHGAPGRNLKAQFDVMLVRQPTRFTSFPDFNFDDPSREFVSESQSLFEGTTDAEGFATVTGSLQRDGAPSGLLNAIFRGKVFEESGNFSIDRFSIPYYPYSTFVGMRIPQGERYSGILYTDKKHKISLATVDTDGKGISRSGLEINMYKLHWRWWWDTSSDRVANFMESSYTKLVKSATVNTVKGKGEWSFELPVAEYGRYFIRVCDPVSGHCAGQVVYVDEPGWWSRARADDARGGANLLSFSTDKTSYNIGDKINVTIPGSGQGRALVSIENGSKVLQTYWVETQKGENRLSIDVIPEMAPNVYVHVSLLQPHAQTVNDLPIRLYGVTGVQVEDPATHLEPEVVMPDVLVPDEPVAIRVSEKTNRKMTYTLAMVDEGLLDITRFKTPDPWRTFYAREALGVRTWDVYDYVMGAFGASLERFISIGGDDAIAGADADPMANRFKPVVKFFGPYTLDGGSQEIKFTMPSYIGSVKTMVIAGYEGAYGKTEKVSAVRKPLMVLATLPRVLGPEETVSLPVTLFTGEKNLPKVNVEVKTKGPISVKGERTKSVTLSGKTDMTIDFELAVNPETGVAAVEVVATAGSFKSSDIIEIQVRNPNLPVTRVNENLVEENKAWTAAVTPFGISGSNTATLEISTLPPINLTSRMRYLLQYPHGCIEQTTSSVFPQLYLDQVKVLTDAEKEVIQRNVRAGIERLKSFVQRDGGFGYWPGLSESSDGWGTSYAGHFLIEAESKGYYVSADLVRRWKTFQTSKALEWRRNNQYYNSDLLQAYRLYTLALAGAPELGAMNRMREESNLSSAAAWMLASSFAIAGQNEAARKLIANLPTSVSPYRELGYTYGSSLRDKALILETLVLLGDKVRAFEILKEISNALADQGYWMSTQESAMCLRAVGSFASKEKRGDMNFTYKIGSDKTVTATTGLPFAQIQIPLNGVKEKNIEVTNKGKGTLFARLIVTGTPARGDEEDASKELTMQIQYTDTKGNPIDPSRLEQGTEFVALVSVSHPGVRGYYENLALSQVFPSGWEINNLRLDESEQLLKTASFRYQDIRDDRVFTYFNLSPREEKTFRVLITAAYAGEYYLPAVSCEAMYDGSIYARKKGRAVSVVKAVTQ